MKHIPSESALISAAAFLRDGYPFIQNGVNRHHSDVFQMELAGLSTICIHGPESTALFYDQDLFVRNGAIPKRIQKTLLGENGIHTMDDEAHRHRKEMFLALMTPEESIQHLMQLMTRYWKAYCQKWEKVEQVVLFEEVLEIFCLAACEWAGIPLQPTEVREKSQKYWAMVDAFGAVGPRHWRGRKTRPEMERWIGGIIQKIRNGKLEVPLNSAAYAVAWHRDHHGKLLSTDMAAVELINATRPIVAVAAYVAFAAHAMCQHPSLLPKLRADNQNYVELFVQEVRRYYPFAPFLGARVRKDFDWKGYRFEKGKLVLLDIYGALHDPALWEDAESFNPERFRSWNGNPHDYIPQGGGLHDLGHRCPGEWITIEALKLAVRFLASYITYEVPEQEMGYSLLRMPSIPKSRFLMQHVKRTGMPIPATTVPAFALHKCPYLHQ